MATIASKVQKLVVYDSRMLQSAPRYAIERGALSVNPQIFNALTASASAHTFAILPPFQDVFWDRYLLWDNTTGIKVECTFTNNSELVIPAGSQRLFEPGGLWALAPFPNTQLVTSIQATFNNGTVTTQLNDTLDTQLRMCALWANNSLRVAPCKMDRYARVSESLGTLSSLVAGYETTVDSSTVPNTGNASYWFTTSAGGEVAPGYIDGDVIYDNSGQPHNRVDIAPINGSITFTVYLKVRSVEPIWLSPLIFSDVMEEGTAITGIKTASLVINLRSPGAARFLRYNGLPGVSSTTIRSVGWASGFEQTNSSLQAVFLSAPLSLPKAPASVIPYIDVPRYPFSGTASVAQLSDVDYHNLSFHPERYLHTITSNVITFQQIPDLLAVSVRPLSDDYSFQGKCDPFEQGKWLFPIFRASITFNNRSGLLASATQEQLFHMSRRNGLRDVDWNMFRGWAISAGDRVQTVGSSLLLRPTDWGLDDAMAPGLNGAWSFQITVQFYVTCSIKPLNPLDPLPAITPEVVVMPYNSGFFVTREGESERVMGVLTQAEIVGAATAPYIDRSELARVVGAGMLSLTQHAPGRMRGWSAVPRAPAPVAGGGAMYGGAAPTAPPADAPKYHAPAGLMADRLRGR